MLSRILITVAGVGGLGVVTADAVMRCAPRIERDIDAQVRSTFAASGFGALDVEVDGRALSGSGTVDSQPLAARAVSVARSIPGVGHVVDGVKVARPPAPEPSARAVPTVATVSAEGALNSRVVRFETSSDVLTGEGHAVLDALVHSVRGTDDRVLDVEGRADARGDEAYNQELSLRRAEAVVGYLRARLPGVYVRAAGFGETRPVADNATDDGRRLNRRVEIRFLEEESR